MKKCVVVAASVVLALGALAAPAVAAEPSQQSAAEAQALFEEGKRLVAAEQIDEGCKRLEESQRISPAGGTILHLAACREAQGRLATAWEHYHSALSQARSAGRKDREKVAAARLEAIEPRLTRVRILVPPLARISKLSVKRDGAEVDAAVWGVAVPVDPGEHEIVASAPAHKAWTSKLSASKNGGGETIDVTVPVLGDETTVATSPTSAPRDQPARPHQERDDGLSDRRIGAIAAAATGLAAIGLGTYFYFDSVAKKRAADDLCGGPPPTPCPEDGVAKADDAKTSGTIATIGFGIGIAGLAVGAVLWFLDPSKPRTASLGPAGQRLTAGGSGQRSTGFAPPILRNNRLIFTF